MSFDNLTVGQIWVLNYAEDYKRARGWLPTLAEIAEATGLGDGTVSFAVEYLLSLGYLPEDRETAA